jgi:dTDP-4-amino-4,6-dideoxygalactose transaminase
MNDNEMIAFLDLVSLHEELEKELIPVFQEALRTAGFIGGPMVEEFEREFARFCDATHCVGVGSGTDALRFALVAAGVQPGDVVLTVPNTFIATTEAISQAGARPDFVDIDERTYNLDPVKLEKYLQRECYPDPETGKPFHRKSRAPVTAVVPVHLYGQTADMDAILDLARIYKLIVVEDACQAHGAEYFSKKENRWRKAGSMGHAAAFSFYPGKNLGACGEAGAAVTNSEEIARKVCMLRDHGQTKKYYHDMEGYNGRLDAIQAGILAVKLRHLSEWNCKRQVAARKYDELFSSVNGVIAPYCPDWARAVYHLYVVRVQDRAGLRNHLAGARVDTGIHYPVPLHLQKAYQGFGYKQGDFPITEHAASEIVSLPMFPQLTTEQQARIVDEIVRFLHREMLPVQVGAGFTQYEVQQGTR